MTGKHFEYTMLVEFGSEGKVAGEQRLKLACIVHTVPGQQTNSEHATKETAMNRSAKNKLQFKRKTEQTTRQQKSTLTIKEGMAILV